MKDTTDSKEDFGRNSNVDGRNSNVEGRAQSSEYESSRVTYSESRSCSTFNLIFS